MMEQSVAIERRNTWQVESIWRRDNDPELPRSSRVWLLDNFPLTSLAVALHTLTSNTVLGRPLPQQQTDH